MNEGITCTDKGLDGTALKTIALVSMLIDHFGVAILYFMYNYKGELRFISPLMSRNWGPGLLYAYFGCRAVGRLAFPIFCFLLTEGFIHTHDRRKYCLRMAVFACIAEIPYELALINRPSWDFQNVFFELFLGLLTLQGLKKAEEFSDIRRSIYGGLSVVIGSILAWLIKADYSCYGIMLMSFFYILRGNRYLQLLTGGVMAFVQSLLSAFGAAALAFVPLSFYNGKRGKGNMKYLFYWFYPVHLLLLFGLRWFVLGIPFG